MCAFVRCQLLLCESWLLNISISKMNIYYYYFSGSESDSPSIHYDVFDELCIIALGGRWDWQFLICFLFSGFLWSDHGSFPANLRGVVCRKVLFLSSF